AARPPGFSRRRKRARKSRLGLWAGLAVVVLVGFYVVVLISSRPNVEGDKLRTDTFFRLVEERRVPTAVILDQDAYVVGTYVRDDGTPGRYNTPYLRFSSREGLVDLLYQYGAQISIDPQLSKRLLDPAVLLIPVLILVVILVYLILSHRRRSGLFGIRSGAKRIDGSAENVSFADVAGQDGAVTELKEIKAFLTDPERFAALGARVPKGILLFGPPGCGKTLLARAVASEAGAAFYSISGSDFVEMYVGVGAARVRDLFKEARENAPAIVFIDELDSVGRRRGGRTAESGGNNGEQEQALNQILAELDGFSPLEGIIVMGATNRPDVLDPALLRQGRFDRTIGLERPDEHGRRAILEVHARAKPLDPLVDLAEIARRAVGLSGADLAGVMNEAALLAARADQQVIGAAHLATALTRIMEAPERQRRLSMRDRSFGRTTGADARVTFRDVAGVDEALEELVEVREYLAEPERFVAMGARPPRGFLLVGPPGCGKTLLARAVASEANAAFFSVAATEFVEVFAGEGAGRVRDLFSEAKAVAPSIVFLDEIDAVGSRRGAEVVGQREREQTLNQILVELDGFDARSGVIVMAATNRPEILDEALVRPGRFDRTITLNLPDRAGRLAILGLHSANKHLAADVDLRAVAGLTQGFSGAELANVCNEAALLATRQGRLDISMAIVEQAVERVGTGITRVRALSREDRIVVAYHELGHALVGMARPGARTPHKISIVARGMALGATWHLDDAEPLIHSRSALIDQMAGLLGGRAAEELIFGEPGSGAADDLARVSEIARRMVCELGMSDAVGPQVFSTGGAGGPGPAASDEAARTIDAEIRRLIGEAQALATAVLASKRDVLDRAVEVLLERETLTAAELKDLTRTPTSGAPAVAAAAAQP
ncbi:MAG: AAA family ATPase, partial [Acidimicrobiales bacterium]